MYEIIKIVYQELNTSLLELIQFNPNRSFYKDEKPPLVLKCNGIYYWCEITNPAQTQNCLVKSTDSIENLLNTTADYHSIKHSHAVIQANFIAQSRSFLSQFSYSKTDIPMLNFPSSHLEKQYRDIAALPKSLLQVMINKNFSLKQCHYFCRFNADFITIICDWLLVLNPTATQLKQCCQLLFDITRRDKASIKQIITTLKRTSISDIISQLTRRYQPTLAQLQQELELIKSGYSLPVSWDPSLEKREVTLVATIRSKTDFIDLKKQLSDPRSQEGIQKLLARL